ncbi:TetR/AcrR family transcriptional regulator [Cytobacillus solani]|uniref:TetR family transcriptional regulator n=1 Tax=Cytobacillus solani TaxID=1637975 RepID=A0A0Q3U388_9BACI|nr:TetR/AcrR family transcriptional regulator [Cytobacillus solani]KOP77668.1 TetR family transcriptional regulator [Bacillus sp. FJAT-21945]KQL17538.1 TetR family transcriptional regulator [Cytobacillus solani]USK55396.1 TetR/AcrR family transcriptional regulator [Cytobacillus solani]
MDGFERRRVQKKMNILEAALALFMEYGVQKISIAEIAKEANVSQVTIYNYFDSKHNLVREVFLYYVEKAMDEFDQILNGDIAFPEKIKQIIFTKKETANQIHEDFYQYLMKEYTTGVNYIEKMYVEQIIPRLIDLFNEGKKQGHVDPNVSNEAILFFIQAVHEYIQREDVYQKILPLTEDIMRLMFYGIVGKKED